MLLCIWLLCDVQCTAHVLPPQDVKAVHLETELFAPENDLMTPSFKLKRSPLQKRYQVSGWAAESSLPLFCLFDMLHAYVVSYSMWCLLISLACGTARWGCPIGALSEKPAATREASDVNR